MARALRSFWQARSARERMVLAIGAVLVAVLASYGGLWRPLRADLERLADQLPRMRAQATQVKQAAEEIARLRGRAPAGAIERNQLAALLRRLAADHNLPTPALIADADTARVQATFERVGFDAWLAWIDELHRAHRVVVTSARVSALDRPGMVRAEVELTLAFTQR